MDTDMKLYRNLFAAMVVFVLTAAAHQYGLTSPAARRQQVQDPKLPRVSEGEIQLRLTPAERDDPEKVRELQVLLAETQGRVFPRPAAKPARSSAAGPQFDFQDRPRYQSFTRAESDDETDSPERYG